MKVSSTVFVNSAMVTTVLVVETSPKSLRESLIQKVLDGLFDAFSVRSLSFVHSIGLELYLSCRTQGCSVDYGHDLLDICCFYKA